MKSYDPMECQSPECRKIFTPLHFNQVYCCKKCADESAVRRKQEHRRKEREKKKHRVKLSAAWDEVNAFIENYKQETGKFITYGKAVLLMEQQRKEGKK